MKAAQQQALLRIVRILSVAGFVFGALFWLYTQHRFGVLYFQESTQLFRTDALYWQSYLQRPGGIVAYCASWLTQWYHYPLLGAAIAAVVIASITSTLWLILTRNTTIRGGFIFPLIPALGLLMASAEPEFRLAYPLAILVNLLLFYLYAAINPPRKYAFACLLVGIAYLCSGGAFWLFVALLVVHELFRLNKSTVWVLIPLALALVLPAIGRHLLYVASANETAFSYTPFWENRLLPYFKATWLAIPVIYLLFRLADTCFPAVMQRNPAPVWTLPVAFLFAAGAFFGLEKVTDNSYELSERLCYEMERRNWDNIIEISHTHREEIGDRILHAYCMNLAYAEKGVLASKMFEVEQTGTYGLFINWSLHYRTIFQNSELYYNLGIMSEAEHGAFESLVLCPGEHGSKMLRRLLHTNMLRKDDRGFEKYVRLFEKSPVYKRFAREQRIAYERYTQELHPVQPEGLPTAGAFPDFYINHAMPEYNLVMLLRADSTDRKAFEYLLASIMLQKDLPLLKRTMDRFYAPIGYTQLPRYLEEALVIYMHVHKDMSVAHSYPIHPDTIERFNCFLEDQSPESATKETLREKYQDTFWFYYAYTQAFILKNVDEITIY